jgi:hypothetical protein
VWLVGDASTRRRSSKYNQSINQSINPRARYPNRNPNCRAPVRFFRLPDAADGGGGGAARTAPPEVAVAFAFASPNTSI